MITQFVKNIEKTKLFGPDQSVILAVSGGMDSVVMAHLFYRSGYQFALAHCNFKLRGNDSELDELFVKELADKLNVPFYCKSFNTKLFAKTQKVSIQMAARDLRYRWFEELRKSEGYNYVATAHHKNDLAETVLINLARGTGLRGLKGVPMKGDGIIRPLLIFERKEIEAFVNDNELKYREDSTNKEEKYLRNKIRHQVVPVFEEINPSFIANIEELSRIVYGNQSLLDSMIDQVLGKYVKKEGDTVRIPIDVLSAYAARDVLLFELLREYGFQPSVVSDIAESLEGQAGKIFYSSSHSCLKDRDYLIISTQKEPKADEYSVNFNQKDIIIPGAKLIFSYHKDFSLSQIIADNNTAFMDADKLRYPLVLRKPRHGDYFLPLGMSGKKKISDFLTDVKIPRTEKKNIWLLTSDDKIAWVVGFRIDNRFRVKKTTQRVLEIKLLDQTK